MPLHKAGGRQLECELSLRPADTVLTRMYNQNTVKDPITGRVRGALYTNPIDCLWKTFKAEGIAGWYKGTSKLPTVFQAWMQGRYVQI